MACLLSLCMLLTANDPNHPVPRVSGGQIFLTWELHCGCELTPQ